MAKQANKTLKDHAFKAGDNVLLSTKNISLEHSAGTRKLQPRFCGPFTVLKRISDVTAKLDLSAPTKAKDIHDAVHVSLLNSYAKDTFQRYPEKPPPIQFSDSHEEYKVEKILNHRRRRGKHSTK